MAKYYCQKCQKEMDERNFYGYRDGRRVELCKACLTMHIDNFDPDTFLWILEKLDYPYIEQEWNVIRDKAYSTNPAGMTGKTVLGKYISKMKLKSFKDYGWADTERIREERQQKDEARKKLQEEQKEYLQKQFEEGKINEAEYKTLVTVEDQYKQAQQNATIQPAAAVGLDIPAPHHGDSFYGDDYIAEDDLPDLSEELTSDDKVRLALKWGRLYKPAEWIELEQKYNDFMSSFDIQGAARIDTLKFICKTSLKMHQAIDAGDFESYQRLAKVYDAQMKSAKFTEAQRKEERMQDFGCYGQIVAYCEKINDEDYIHPINLNVDRDIVDKDLRNMKEYTRNLIQEDPAVFKAIEAYLKRKQNLENAEMDAEGLEEGEVYELTDKDFKDFRDFEDQLKEEEKENINAEGGK